MTSEKRPIKDRIKIVVGCDLRYFRKAHQIGFFKSLENQPYEVNMLCIGFNIPKDIPENFKCLRVELDELKSYTKGYPENREFYYSLETGDFLDFFDYEDDDIIFQADVDAIFQRDLNDIELSIIENIKYGELAGSFFSHPRTTLGNEWNNLRPTGDLSWAYNKDQEIICCGLIVARVDTYKYIYHSCVNLKELVQKKLKHHASMQWFINYIFDSYGKIIDLGENFHNAEWFTGHKTECKDGKLYDKDGLVYFNHTKFNPKYYYNAN